MGFRDYVVFRQRQCSKKAPAYGAPARMST